MLQHDRFYWATIRKVCIAFGAIFSDIHVWRLNEDGIPEKKIEVPCEWGPKEKWMVRNTQNQMPGVDDQVEMVLPRMSFEVTGLSYEVERKLTSTGPTIRAVTSDNKVMKVQLNPVPYNVGFVLNIMTKNYEDALMIIEQIVPFFTPDYTISINDIPDLQLTKDIPIVLNTITPDDQNWEGNFQQRRTLLWYLNFTAKMYLYPPVGLTKLNLKTNIVWHLSQSMTADISAMDILTPAPGSTPGNVIPNIQMTQGPSFQQMIGRARVLRRPVVNQYGVSAINNSVPATPNFETIIGTATISNPAAFVPGIQEYPIPTHTELMMELQRGIMSVRNTTEQNLNGISTISS